MKDYEKFIFSLKKEERSLRAIKEFLSHLGNPQNEFKSVHIGGSNGKGSVTEMIYRILAERYLAGRYISPHITKFNERIAISGEEIEDDYIEEFVEQNRNIVQSIKMHFFDFITAMAFKYFADKSVEWASVEVGLGGRYDSTNVIRPVISVITGVSYEHTDKLGSSMEEITTEKAGIIKASPVVIGPMNRLAMEILKRKAKRYLAVDEHIILEDYEIGERFVRVEVSGEVDGKFQINSGGKYQINNILTALLTGKFLADMGVVEWSDIRKGLYKSNFPGRFEVFEFEGRKIILDCAHNPSAARYLADTYLHLYGRDGCAVVVQMRDKNYHDFLREISRAVKCMIIPKYDYWRAASQEKMVLFAKKFCDEVIPAESVSSAMEIAENYNINLVTGSTYLVGDVRRWLVKER